MCPWTQGIWSHPQVKITIPSRGVNIIDIWLANLIENREFLPDLETVASILWQIWKARNHFVFRKQRPDPEQVVEVALANARIACRCDRMVSQLGQMLPNLDMVWRPLEPGVVKINIDGAFPTASNKGTMACVYHDHSRKLVDGFTSDIQASSAL